MNVRESVVCEKADANSVSIKKISVEQLSDQEEIKILRICSSGENVQYDVSCDYTRNRASKISDENKFSRKYYDCIGVLLSGVGEHGTVETQLFHFDPGVILLDSEYGKETLEDRFEEFVSCVQPGTVRAHIFGGKSTNRPSPYEQRKQLGKSISDDHREIKALVKSLLTAARIPHTVAQGPIKELQSTDAYFDATNNKLIILEFKKSRIDVAKLLKNTYIDIL